MGSACGRSPGSSGVESDRASTPVSRGRARVQAGDDGPVVRAGSDEDGRAGRDLEALDLREPGNGLIDGRDLAGRRDPQERVAPVGALDREDPAVVRERVRRAAEDPGGVAELRLHRRQVARGAVEAVGAIEGVQVPPAGLVRDVVQDAVGAPGGLHDRDPGAAGDGPGGAERAVGEHLGDAEAGRVPGHARQVPLEPGEARAVGRRARRGDEVRARHDHPAGAIGAVEGDRDELVDDEVRAVGLVRVVGLAHRVEAVARGVEAHVREPAAVRRRQGDRLGEAAGVEPPQPAVLGGRGDDPATVDGIRAAAVLVDPVADGERGGRQLVRRAVGRVAQQRPPAALGRPRLEPVDVVAVEPRLGQRDRRRRHELDVDRGAPAPEGRRLDRSPIVVAMAPRVVHARS